MSAQTTFQVKKGIQRFLLSHAELSLPDSTKKSGQRLVGDVDFASAAEVASYITPVPGGVGPMTVALLMDNTLKSAERLWNASRERKVRPLKLNILEPVPRSANKWPSLLTAFVSDYLYPRIAISLLLQPTHQNLYWTSHMRLASTLMSWRVTASTKRK